jgi:DNA-binding transcriptional MerR regulator
MRDLCERSGLPRQAIHFYIQEGLLPEGRKTGRNMAYYGEEHLERIRLIRQLQEERFLPLRAIRAVLGERDDAFTAAQRRLLLDVKQRLGPRVAGTRPGRTVDARSLLQRVGLDARDLDEMVDVGVVTLRKDARGRERVAEEDTWIFELWGDVRRLGFTRELGFTARLLGIYEEALTALLGKETVLITEKLQQVPPERVARMVEGVLPIIGAFLARYHETKVRNLFSSI